MSYDPSICMLNYFDGNWLFALPNQCIGQQCSWNVYDAPFYDDTPAAFNMPLTYTCDNQLHPLNWTDDSTNPYHPGFNRYSCACGQPIQDNQFTTSKGIRGCPGRCNRPWTAAFGKRCNIITEVTRGKGNFTNLSVDSAQGACENVAGTGITIPTAGSSITPNALTTIDGIGITFVCNNKPSGDSGSQKICNCDGNLPEKVFGRKVTNRNPCNLDTSKEAATASTPPKWIAAPIVLGVAIIAGLAIAFWLFYKKRKRAKSQAKEAEEDGIALEEFHPSLAPAQTLSVLPSAPLTPTSSNPSTETADSGIALLNNRQPETSKAAAVASASH